MADLQLTDLLRTLVEVGGSDLHLKVGLPAVVRIKGLIQPLQTDVLTREGLQIMLHTPLTPAQIDKLFNERELDFSLQIDGVARFRGNLFWQKGNLGAVFRVIPSQVPDLTSLQMPEVIKTLATREQGLVLVTGPTGSGKSTTLAAMIDYLNNTQSRHIVTIEDPIEFVHQDKSCIVNQREVGTDTKSFSEALRRALRQDPDVILVGEMRDAETITIAMTAAETGHVVFSTLHTNDAKQTIDRIINAFPPEEQHQVRMQLALVLAGVVSQRLVRRADGGGRVAAQEILVNSPTARKAIEDGKQQGLDKIIEESRDYYGMQSLNHSLMDLWQQGIIGEQEALATSNNAGDLRMKMQTLTFSTQQHMDPNEYARKQGLGAGGAAPPEPPPRPKPGLESRYG